MASPTPSLPEPPSLPALAPEPFCVPYAQATPQQLTCALAFGLAALREHFPTLSFGPWVNALLQLQPDLWVEDTAVYLAADDLAHLTQYLAASPELPELAPPIYPGNARYLAKRLVNYQDEALEALADIALHPLAYSSRVFELVSGLALGNSVADEVFRATHRGPQGRPGGVDPAGARATAHQQVRALRRARGEPAASWAIKKSRLPPSLD